MPNYKSAKDLGITESFREALIATKEMLAAGGPTEGALAMGNSMLIGEEAEKIAGYSCPSAGCIGGWAKVLELGLDPRSLSEEDTTKIHEFVMAFGREYEMPEGFMDTSSVKFEKLHALFFPDEVGNWDEITPEIAAMAIDKYLQGEWPNWLELLDGE